MTTTPTAATEPPGSIRVAYRLTAADVLDYLAAEEFRSWSGQVRSNPVATALLAGLVLGLAGLAGLGLGIRAAFSILGSALIVLGAFGRAGRAASRRRAGRLARDLGIPADLRVVVSDRGIAKMTGAGIDDPGRRFPWSEVAAIGDGPGPIAFRLRPGDAVLLIPGRAFATAEARAGFVARARRWREDAGPVAASG